MNFALRSISVLLLLGFSHSAQAASPKVRIAFIAGFTGSDPNTAKELERGLDVFLHAYPQSRKDLEIIREDNKGSVLETVRLIEKNAADGIKINIGIARSDEALAAAKIANKLGVQLVTPFATSAKLRESESFAIQICFNDETQAKALAVFVHRDLKLRKVLVLTNTESIYSTGLSAQFQKELSTLNSLIKVESKKYNSEDLKSAEIDSLVAQFRPDIVFIPDHITRAALLAKSINKVDARVKFLGGDGFGGRKVLMSVFKDAPSIELYFSTHWESGIDNSVNRKFLKGYAHLYPSDEPTTGAALTFDAFKIAFEVLSGSKDKDRQSVLKLAGHRFDVSTGTFKVSREGSAADKSVVIMHVKDGEYRVFKSIAP